MGLFITSGKLDTPITIQALTSTSDGMGGETQAWATVAKSPKMAQHMALRGTEAVEAGKITSNEMFKLRIRRMPTLTTTHRVQVDGKNAKIKAIEDGRRSGDMVLWCEVVS